MAPRHYALNASWPGSCQVFARQSDAACTYKKTFGCALNGELPVVWIAGGCRGVFTVGKADGDRMMLTCGRAGGPAQTVCPVYTWAPLPNVTGANRTEFVMENGCVAYRRLLAPREVAATGLLLAQAVRNASAPSGWSLAPRSFPGYFDEGVHWLKPAVPPSDALVRELNAKRLRWSTGREGVVLDLTMDNLFHVVFNAVPSLSSLARRGVVVDPSTTDLIPRYTVFWPSQYVGVARPSQADSSYWPGWEVYVRAVVGAATLATARADTAVGARAAGWHGALLRTRDLLDEVGTVHCYKRLVGGHPRWWPSGSGRAEFDASYRAARPLVAHFRAAVMATVRMRRSLATPRDLHRTMHGPLHEAPAASKASASIVFELRHGTRVIVNDGALRERVAANARLASRVRFVSLASLSVSRQLEIVGGALGLAGVHGAALALVIFLPTDRWPCSVFEIKMYAMKAHPTHSNFDYPRLAQMGAVKHLMLRDQPDAPECVNRPFRICGNLTVDLDLANARLEDMLAWSDSA